MIVLVHVLIALSSLVYSGYLLVNPLRGRFAVAYGLIGLTLISGTYLVISTHTPLTGACVAGLSYLAAVSIALAGAQRRLVAIKNRQSD